MSVHPEPSSLVALSRQGPVAQSPISKLSGLMSVLSLVVHKAGCSKRLEGPSPPQAAGKEPTLGMSLLWPRSLWQVAKDTGVSPLIVPCMGVSDLAWEAQDGSLPNWMRRTVNLPSCDLSHHAWLEIMSARLGDNPPSQNRQMENTDTS